MKLMMNIIILKNQIKLTKKYYSKEVLKKVIIDKEMIKHILGGLI